MAAAKNSKKRSAPSNSGPARKKAHVDKSAAQSLPDKKVHRKMPVTSTRAVEEPESDDEEEWEDVEGEGGDFEEVEEEEAEFEDGAKDSMEVDGEGANGNTPLKDPKSALARILCYHLINSLTDLCIIQVFVKHTRHKNWYIKSERQRSNTPIY